jgi:hypothetical protein
MVVLGEVGNAAPAVVLEQGARMALTETFIRDCADDDALFRALADELSRRVPRGTPRATLRACAPCRRGCAR